MASTDSLLDAHEVVVRARVDELRAEAARVAAALGEAELSLEHVVITRATLALVVAGSAGPATDVMPAAGQRGSVPPWTAGVDERVLPEGYRRLWAVVVKAPDGVRCKAVATALGLEPVPKKVEGVRSKLRRLVRQGWAVETAPGLFQAAVM